MKTTTYNKNGFFILRISGVLPILLSVTAPFLVQAQEFIPGEFVLVESNELLQDKALTLIDQAADQPIAVTDTSTVGMKIETPEGYDPESIAPDEDICVKLRRLEMQRQAEGKINRRFYRSCSRNGVFKATRTTNDPYYYSMWGLQRLQMPAVWDRTTGSSDVVVAVVDTGVNYNHPDLAANIWTNPGEIPGNGIDDDHNGYVDDVHGYNAFAGTGDPMDDNGHGSHVSGTIGARSNNGIGVSGINWDVKIMATKFLSSNGSGSLWGAINSLRYIRTMKQRGVNVVLTNNSWGGGGYYQALFDEIQATKNDGILFVADAGNDTINMDASPQYPASYDLDNIISVGAIDSSGGLAYYSNYGTSVDIAAPGSQIDSCWHNGGYNSISGTSMATPHVSGALALMKAASPGLNWTQLKQYLLTFTSYNTALTGKIANSGELNILSVLQNLPYAPPPTPTPPPPTPTRTFTPTPVATPTNTATPTQTPTPLPGNLHLRVLSGATGLSQVTVTISGGGVSRTATTGVDGRFDLMNLSGGAYTATFLKSGYAFPVSTPIYINGETYTDVFAARNEYVVKGFAMRRENATGIGNLSVDLYVNGQTQGTTVTATDGSFSFTIPYGTRYRLEARSPDYYTESVNGIVLGKATRILALINN